MRLSPAIGVLFALALMPTGSAACAPTDSTPTLTFGGEQAGITVGSAQPGSATFYLAVDTCAGCGAWLYQESNGLAGLQRADWDHDDTCGGTFRSDLLVF